MDTIAQSPPTLPLLFYSHFHTPSCIPLSFSNLVPLFFTISPHRFLLFSLLFDLYSFFLNLTFFFFPISLFPYFLLFLLFLLFCSLFPFLLLFSPFPLFVPIFPFFLFCPLFCPFSFDSGGPGRPEGSAEEGPGGEGKRIVCACHLFTDYGYAFLL